MKILYVGPFRIGSLTEARRHALINCGHKVIGLDLASYFDVWPYFLHKIQAHLLIGPGIARYNQDIIRYARRHSPDLIYLDSGIYLRPNIVKSLRSMDAKLVHYTSEYLGFRSYLYRHFFKTIGLYDAHIITNSLNKDTLAKKGAKKIVITKFGYDPLLHQPPTLTPEEKIRYESDAVFVGHWEPTTERMVFALRKRDIAVKVWGTGWRNAKSLNDHQHIQPISHSEYTKVLAASKICLCFLSKWNRNQSAGRTFEIPAVGGFLLAERTLDHLSSFKEGEEAEFFSSVEELASKTEYYLKHEDQRLNVANAGRQRCLTSGYTHQDRVREFIEEII